MAHTPTSDPMPAPATELYKSRWLWALAALFVLALVIPMIIGSFSRTVKPGEVGATPTTITYSTESPIYFGPSKCVAIDLMPGEWSPVIVTPERCKSASWAINPPVGYFIELPGGEEIEVTPGGKQGFLPPIRGRGEYRFRAKQAGQKLVMHVMY